MEPQARLGPEMDEAMAVWRKSAFRLLALTLLIFAVSGLVPATGLWRIVVGGITAVVLAGLIAAWIGLARHPGRAAMEPRPDRSTATPYTSARPSIS